MTRSLIVTVAVCLLAFPLLAQEHQSRFEFSEEFVRSWSAQPVRDVQVTFDCAGPVHTAEKDCEVHIGSAFVDPSFTDFPNVVLQPPDWRAWTRANPREPSSMSSPARSARPTASCDVAGALEKRPGMQQPQSRPGSASHGQAHLSGREL